MKKIIAAVTAFLLTTTVHAEKLLVTYDASGVLSSALVYEEGKTYEIPSGFSAFLYNMEEFLREEYIPKTEEVEEVPPVEEVSSVYETEKDAISAFAIVTKVSKTLDGDEPAIKVEALYQGREKTFLFAEDITIGSAPEYKPELLGMDAQSLKRGDIINISFAFSGKIKSLNLIARLPDTEIITDNTDFGYSFEKIYSFGGRVWWGSESYPANIFGTEQNERVQYQFGVITDKQDGYYTISNKAGLFNEMTEISFLPETICYICDIGNRYQASLGTVYDIEKSYVPSAYFDDDGNITAWDPDVYYTYALSRTVDGVATDIVIFNNFK